MLRVLILFGCLFIHIRTQIHLISKKKLQQLAQQALLGVEDLYYNSNTQTTHTLQNHREHRGMTFSPGSSAYLLATFSRVNKVSKELAKGALLSENVTLALANQFRLSKEDIHNILPTFDVQGTALEDVCQTHAEKQDRNIDSDFNLPECAYNPYRTLNGTCNNIIYLQWGSAPRRFNRFIPSSYADGVSAPRVDKSGDPLPSARFVRATIISDAERPDRRWTLMLMQWGQFIDHDLTHTAGALDMNGEVPVCCNIPVDEQNFFCLPITIPKDDYFYSQYNQTCLEFLRNLPAPRPGCSLGPREQINQLTAYLDASVVYGSDDELANQLRTHQNGHLKTTPLPPYKDLLPKDPREEGDCVPRTKDEDRCFLSGDIRVNEQSSLTTMHTIWLREHNRIVKSLLKINPACDDETLYQEGRRIVAAEIQLITFKEFLPIILGKEWDKYDLKLLENDYYKGYNIYTDVTINNVFASAAYRFGHTLLQPKFDLYNIDNQLMANDDAVLSKMFFKPFQMYLKGRVDEHIRGLLRKNVQSFDDLITEEVTNHLFQESDKPYGMDLISLNIQRGRDHGIPGYTRWREFCGNRKPENFDDLAPIIPAERIYKFREMYKHVEDIDLFPAGVSELPVEDGVLGPTFACIVARQFEKIRKGDRFWFENSMPIQSGLLTAFTLDQLNEIRKVSLAKVICDNSDHVPSLQKHVMMPSSGSSNPVVNCSELLTIDFTKWKNLPTKAVEPRQLPPLKLKSVVQSISS